MGSKHRVDNQTAPSKSLAMNDIGATVRELSVNSGELSAVLRLAESLPVADLPRLLGSIETVRATALQRLLSPAPSEALDKLLDVGAAASRLGVSVAYLHRHHKTLPFTRRMGRSLLFSSLGIQDYIRRQGALTPRRQRAILTAVR